MTEQKSLVLYEESDEKRVFVSFYPYAYVCYSSGKHEWDKSESSHWSCVMCGKRRRARRSRAQARLANIRKE